MAARQRLDVFGWAALVALLIDLVVTALAANLNTALSLQRIVVSAADTRRLGVFVRPNSGAAMAGLGAGGVIGMSFLDKNAILTGGVLSTPAVVLGAVGLVGTAVLLAAQLVRISNAGNELRDRT